MEISSSLVEPGVVRKSPEISAFAPAKNASSPLLPKLFLPAAHLIVWLGIINLKTEIVLNASSCEIFSAFSSGVPFIGVKIFIGTD